jgi:hypothetical protein
MPFTAKYSLYVKRHPFIFPLLLQNLPESSYKYRLTIAKWASPLVPGASPPNATANFLEFLRSLLHTPGDEILPACIDLTPYYRPWGFTIYQTAYRLSSDQHWQALLNGIFANVIEQITRMNGEHQADPVAQNILSLFCLDVRSDAESLTVRKVYSNGTGGRPMNAQHRERRYFLLVDEGVIEDCKVKVDTPRYKPWTKCVEVDYVASDYIFKVKG